MSTPINGFSRSLPSHSCVPGEKSIETKEQFYSGHSTLNWRIFDANPSEHAFSYIKNPSKIAKFDHFQNSQIIFGQLQSGVYTKFL